MAFTRYYPVSSHIYDPAVAPTKAIQTVVALDNSKMTGQNTARFDTTYRTEYTNRIRHTDQYTKPTRQFKSSLNQYSVLPPISANNGNSSDISERRSLVDTQQQPPYNDQEVPTNESEPSYDYNYGKEYYDPQQQQQQQQQQPQQYQPDPYQQQSMMNAEDTYLPEDSVALTDYEEDRLCDQIRTQVGSVGAIDRLKLLFQELTSYDQPGTGFVHYSNIQSLTYQLGLHFQEDTLRFAMCKFVARDRPRGFVNYEELVRYFGKCISSAPANPYGSRRSQRSRNGPRNTFYNEMDPRTQPPPSQQQERKSPQKPVKTGLASLTNDDGPFDPDERQIRVLLKQNLKHFDLTGTIDFDKLTSELSMVDRNQSGLLNRQQIEEVVYKVRIPFQRSLIYQILEKHCRATPKLYDWKAFVQYLREQIFDIKHIQDRSSPIYTHYVPTRDQWLDDLQREFHEKDRQRIIERFVSNNEGVRLESTHPTAWFTRYLRLANAMYTHRRNSNVSQEFVLPREEARRLFRAYNHVWDLKIDDGKMQRVLEMCSRNGHVVIDEALKQMAK